MLPTLSATAVAQQTLTDFVIYLGRTGKCRVDQTPKGWFICYIDRDPAVIARRAEIEKKEKSAQVCHDMILLEDSLSNPWCHC